MNPTNPPSGLNPADLFRYDCRAIEAKIAQAIFALDLEHHTPANLADQIQNLHGLVEAIDYVRGIEYARADWEGDQVPTPSIPRKPRKRRRKGGGPDGLSIRVS